MAPLVSSSHLQSLITAGEKLSAASDSLSAQFVELDQALTPILTKIGLTSQVGLPSYELERNLSEWVGLEVREFADGFKTVVARYPVQRNHEGEPSRTVDALGNAVYEYSDEATDVRTLTQLPRKWRIRLAADGDLMKFVELLSGAIDEKANDVGTMSEGLDIEKSLEPVPPAVLGSNRGAGRGPVQPADIRRALEKAGLLDTRNESEGSMSPRGCKYMLTWVRRDGIQIRASRLPDALWATPHARKRPNGNGIFRGPTGDNLLHYHLPLPESPSEAVHLVKWVLEHDPNWRLS